MIRYMATQVLRLHAHADGYFRTSWIDEVGIRHQRSFGNQAVVARNRFAKFFAEWVSDAKVRTPGISAEKPVTIREGWKRFEKHTTAYYRRTDGTPTGEADNIKRACDYVVNKFGDLAAKDFGPKLLKICRDEMVADDLALSTVNRWVAKIRQMWKFLSAEELVSAEVWHGLQCVDPLKAGRGDVRVTDPVRAVPEEFVWKTVAKLPATVGRMVELQLLTGMRPGELCKMRPVDLVTDGAIWLYRPALHKGSHRGRDRVVLIGPKGQEIIKKRLAGRKTDDVLFSPRDTVRDIGRTPHAGIAPRYDRTSYSRAVRRACVAADVPEWSPNQLRHNAATALRKQFGLDIAQVVLGHSRADVTQVYAELDLQKASAAMEKVG